MKKFTGAAAVAALAQVSREEEKVVVRTAKAAWTFLSWVLLPSYDFGN